MRRRWTDYGVRARSGFPAGYLVTTKASPPKGEKVACESDISIKYWSELKILIAYLKIGGMQDEEIVSFLGKECEIPRQIAWSALAKFIVGDNRSV